MRILLSQAKSGMVLAAPVKDLRGRLLLTQGEALTQRLLAKLPALGVTHVDVADAGTAPAQAPAGPTDARRVEEALELRFSRTPPGVWNDALKSSARRALEVHPFDPVERADSEGPHG